ncbi:MAG: CaiB/BaiF CoA-transferase family protein [Limibacillus sp.]|jgi:crotonobetainyl-CoA:carnitine CoA-transferase CaiB-like acyl-CoA transferase
MPHVPASDALSHIRVLDVTRVRSGPTAARQLADWGADVVKIEPPESIEPDGSLGAARHTPDFQNLQRNKRSLTLNLKEAEGLEIFRKLVADADVVIENFRPDVKQRLGIDYPELKKINPKIIMASISGFGQDGPYAKRPGFDQIAQGMGGLMSITGEPGRGPMRVGIPIADLTAGLFCAHGVLVALISREKTGEGQWLHTSLLQSQIFMLDFQAARWLTKGEVADQAGNNHPTSVPTGVFQTQDGSVNIAVAGEGIWKRLCKVLGKEDWTQNPDYLDNAARLAHRDQLNDEIEAITKTYKSVDLVEMLLEAGVPSGEINKIDEVFADPQVQHLGIATEADTIPYGRTSLVGQPVVLTGTPSKIVQHPPEKGEHTSEILEELGYDAARLADLRERQII